MSQSLLRVSNLKVRLNNHYILENINFEVQRNDTLAIIGPNGSGKTTLFRALLGLIPYEGEIMWQPDIKIGYVPQKVFIDPDLPITTSDFFALKSNSLHEIDSVLASVGFEKNKPHRRHLEDHVLKRKLGVLSGGELQRILIAWALIGRPEVLLFDEPTSGIDISAEETIYSLLNRLQEKENLTILLISHELQVVYKYASNVICLNKKQVCYGPPKVALSETNLTKLFGSHVGLYEHHH